MAHFTDKVIIITGASDGIGAELARQLATQHAKLVLAARSEEKLSAVADECTRLGSECLTVPTDVGRQEDCARLIEATLKRFGKLDGLVNNAGVSGHALFREVSDFGWYEDMMRVNLFGTIWCTHYALDALIASGGLVVGVSSLAGKFGTPGRTAYSPSKFAVAGFFEALRIELRDTRVGVTVVFPGVVDTRIRYHGYGPDGQAAGRSGLREESAMPVAECARQMIEAMTHRRRELVMTGLARLGLWMKLIVPSFVDKQALAALKKDSR